MKLNKSLFTELDYFEDAEVKMADKYFIKVEGKGTVRVKTTHKTCFYQYLNISDVLYMPHIMENLFSISAFERRGFQIIFKDGVCEIRIGDSTLVMTGRRVNCLYEDEVTTATDKTTIQAKLSEETWHKRYSHQSVVTLNKMKNEKLVDGLEFSSKMISKCEECLTGKAVKN